MNGCPYFTPKAALGAGRIERHVGHNISYTDATRLDDAAQRVAPKICLRRALGFAAMTDAAGANARQRSGAATRNTAARSDKNNLVSRQLFTKAIALNNMMILTAPNAQAKPPAPTGDGSWLMNGSPHFTPRRHVGAGRLECTVGHKLS